MKMRQNRPFYTTNIQKKIVRLMTFKSYLEHTEPIFTELKILNLYKLNDY